MGSTRRSHRFLGWAVPVVWSALAGVSIAGADEVVAWNVTAGEVVTAAGLQAPQSNRVLAIVHAAVYEAASTVAQRSTAGGQTREVAPDVSLEAAVAAAAHAALARLVPPQRAAIDGALRVALAKLPDGAPKQAGVAVGEAAAAGVLARRAADGDLAREDYRPRTLPGVWVPTVIPLAPRWPQRTPWLMTGPVQFRPGPPPSLDSESWARDFNEVKELGGAESERRSAAQTESARFWEATLPPIYHGLVRSVAALPGRDVMQNARLFAAVTQASDDALIAVFDAKYHYGFWRPITAVRNGDADGNNSTERDPSWTPLIDTPNHPEYPCAHCIVSAAVGVVLLAELGPESSVTLTTTSPTASGGAHSWSSIDAFVHEVAMARICAGVHYRTSTEVGAAMGRQVGALAVARFPRRDTASP